METLDFSISFGQKFFRIYLWPIVWICPSRHACSCRFLSPRSFVHPWWAFISCSHCIDSSALCWDSKENKTRCLSTRSISVCGGARLRQTQRIRRTVWDASHRIPLLAGTKILTASLPFFSPPGPFASVLSALPFWGTDLITARMLDLLCLLVVPQGIKAKVLTL